MDKTDFQKKYYLSTDGYYFKYREDNNNSEVIRATLYNLKNEKVDDVRVTEGYGVPEKSHHQIINYFEAVIIWRAGPSRTPGETALS